MSDFFDDFFDEDESAGKKENSLDKDMKLSLTDQKLAEHAYLTANTVLNILVTKGIIRVSEVNTVLAELHAQYKQLRGDESDDQ